MFTYIIPTASLFAWGITAPKGGAVWIPGALGGHWWSSDHAQGLCRQDPMSTAPAQFAIAGDPLSAINFSICASDLVGSAGQAVYDPNLVVNLATGVATTFHYVYVPDNAVKSTAVWRLTFDPATETMVADPNGGAFATAMATLVDQRTLKPNGMALGPDGNLYVTDLVDPFVRQITNPGGDPRTQIVGVVAETGDGRGANGTQGFIGNYLYISGNRATQFFDITACPTVGNTVPGPLTGAPCGMASVPAPTGVFIAGTATDPVHKLVYLSNSAGGGPASILRYDASKDVYVKFAFGFYPPDAFGVVHCIACTFGTTRGELHLWRAAAQPAHGSWRTQWRGRWDRHLLADLPAALGPDQPPDRRHRQWRTGVRPASPSPSGWPRTRLGPSSSPKIRRPAPAADAARCGQCHTSRKEFFPGVSLRMLQIPKTPQ